MHYFICFYLLTFAHKFVVSKQYHTTFILVNPFFIFFYKMDLKAEKA